MYTLNKVISSKYKKNQEDIFIEAMNDIQEEFSLSDLYDVINEILVENDKDKYYIGETYDKNKILMLNGEGFNYKNQRNFIGLKNININDCEYFKKNKDVNKDNYKIIRIFDELWHHTTYELAFNDITGEIIFYNSFEASMHDWINYIKFDCGHIIENKLSNDDRDYLIHITCIIGDYLFKFEGDENK